MMTPSTGAPSRAPITLHTIHLACDRHGLARSTFGRLAMGDPRFIDDLSRGRTMRATTQARLSAFLEYLEAHHGA
jgi:hypothetical protein